MFLIYYLIILLFPMYAQFKVQSTYNRFSKVGAANGFTGAQVARMILEQHGLFDVRVVKTPGILSDHYDPTSKTVALSEGIYSSNSLAAIAVAAHECGHAIQHKEAYSFLTFRSQLVPVAKISSNISWIFVLIGMFTYSTGMLLLGIVLLAGGVLFQIVTLPVEFDASKRAMNEVLRLGIIHNHEKSDTKKVLSAAALTYVAAATVAVMELLRLVLVYTGMVNNNSEE